MTRFLLDTCSLLWWTLDQESLSKKAWQACQTFSKEPACVSSISIWEIGIKIKNKKLDLGMTFEEYTQKIRRASDLRILSVGTETWIKNIALDWDHKDPADRTIVATAYLNSCHIITKDLRIREFYSKVTW